ncbi:unnamed protein product, partial [Didymodactylos carnosus]
LQEHESCTKYAQEIFQKVQELKLLPNGSAQRAKMNVTIRTMTNAFDKDVEKLSKDLTLHAKTGLITDGEANRRRTLIDNVQQSQKEIKQQAQDSLSSEWTRPKTDPRSIAGIETDETLQLTNDEFSNMHSTLRKGNDEAIDALHSVVKRQKEMGIAMNSEVDRHNEIITVVTEHTSLLDSRVKRETNLIKIIDRKATTTWMWLIVVLLLIAIIVIAAVPF